MAKYDLESFIADVESLLKTKLNAKIAEIDAEKSDAITLKPIPANGYYFQTLDNKVANINPIILYGIENIDTISMAGSSAQKVTMSIVVIVVDPQDLKPITHRMLRYSRALKETIEDNFALSQNAINLEVQSLVPIAFQMQNSTQSYRAVGINLTATVA